MFDQTQIYLMKRRKVVLAVGQGAATPEVVATAVKNLQASGFGVTPTLLGRIRTLSDSETIGWYESLLPALQQMVGAHREFKPMYPNFPQQVMQASDAALFFNAITHYFGFCLSDQLGNPDLVVLPNYAKEDRPPLEEFHDLRWIDLGSEEDFDSIFTSLASSNGSLSELDKGVLRWFTRHRDVRSILPPQIPQKETLAVLVAVLEDKDPLVPFVKTATDVLRVAVAMSRGDVSLAAPTKFRSFSKSERRFLLNCLEQAGDSRIEDMLRWKERWVRLGERLHPGDFRNRFPQSVAAFDILRNGVRYKTFNSCVESAIASGNPKEALAFLTRRPGEFARRLDHLLRTFPDSEQVCHSFFSIADKVSTPVLLQAWAHFRGRDKIRTRAFFPKGNVAKVQLSETPIPAMPAHLAEEAAQQIRQVLVQRFSKLPSLGKCALDERLKQQFVPFSQRSASRSLRTVSRGSSFDLPPGDTIRFFCWWKNIEACDEWSFRVDIDLSATFFDAQWNYCGDIAYYNLRAVECYHSGDITSAPNGACEFIDLSLRSVLSQKYRYVVMSVLMYTGQPFDSLPECFGGWMMRQSPDSGEVFEPKTVVDKLDIVAATRSCVPVIIDVEQRKVYWTDIGLMSSAQLQVNNAATNSVGFGQIGKAIVELNKPTLYELFEMHMDARSEEVTSPSNADTVFGLYEGTVTAFDTDTILSQFVS